MVSVFPPNYGLVPLFNISENAIFEIIENGFSEIFYQKCFKLLNDYKQSIGIDENDLPFIKRLKKRVKQLNEIEKDKYDYEIELNKVLFFLNEYCNNKENYFKDYVEKGRYLKINGTKDAYKSHKLASITYTPFGMFDSRENKSFLKSSKLLYFDIDGSFNKSETKKLINFFLTDKYIKTSWLSFSKKGFGFVVESEWENEEQMKKNYYKLIEYFTLEFIKLGFNKRLLDTQVCSLSRMNFISQGIIKNKKNNEIYKFENYSDLLFEKLHNTYKTDSKELLPNKILTESDIDKKQIFTKQIIKTTNKEYNEKRVMQFIKNITNKLSFTGSDDYNSTIKNYVSILFRYNIDENLIENYLFTIIPYTDKTEKRFKSMWNSFEKYREYKTIELSEIY